MQHDMLVAILRHLCSQAGVPFAKGLMFDTCCAGPVGRHDLLP
jgi:hypothetical protein